MTTMINTATTPDLDADLILVSWILVDHPESILNDKIDHPVAWPLSPRSLRTAIAEHYDLVTADVKIVSFVLT